MHTQIGGASAFPALIILTIHALFTARRGWLVYLHTALGLFVSFLFIFAVTNFSLVDAAGLSRASRDIRGWEQLTQAIAADAKAYDAIVIDDRSLMGAMLYYNRETTLQIVALDPNMRIDTHYEAFNAFDPNRHKQVLFVTSRSDDAHVNYRFTDITPLGPKTVMFGDQERTYHLFVLSGFYMHSLQR